MRQKKYNSSTLDVAIFAFAFSSNVESTDRRTLQKLVRETRIVIILFFFDTYANISVIGEIARLFVDEGRPASVSVIFRDDQMR